MSRICFVSYEIHPTTAGGCGVLIHHAAAHLLQNDHEVVLLLDLAPLEFDLFAKKHRLDLPHADHCYPYRVDDLCQDFPWSPQEVPNIFQWKSLRFAHALQNLFELESLDFVEFFEYCGAAYYSLATKLYSSPSHPTPIGLRLHGSMELLDRHEAANPATPHRYVMYGMEHAAMTLAEAVLSPGRSYYEHYYKGLYDLAEDRVIVSQPPQWHFPEVRRERGDDASNIVFIGKISELKGVEQLVKAATLFLQDNPQVQCSVDVIGREPLESPFPGEYKRYLQTLVPPALRHHFHFPGFLAHEAMAPHLEKARFAVFPNRIESFCYALHEVYEAGVPIIANDIPAFREFFKHNTNALLYDGSTHGLYEAMTRLYHDSALCRRLSRPHPVATQPLGNYYDDPQIRGSARSATTADPIRPLILLLTGGNLHNDRKTLASLAAQTFTNFELLCLRPAVSTAEDSFHWLGSTWTAYDTSGNVRHALDLYTTSALLLLNSGDELDPEWLELAVGAHRAKSELGFSGTWLSHRGCVLVSDLDLAPEAYPHWHGSRLTRTLLRTQPGLLLLDTFDPQLGAMGEVGYLWQTIRRWGPGCLLPQPLLRAHEPHDEEPNPRHLAYLLSQYTPPGESRQALLTALSNVDNGATPSPESTPFARPVSTPGAEPLVARHQAQLRFLQSDRLYTFLDGLRGSRLHRLLRQLISRNRNVATIHALHQRDPQSAGCEVWLLSAHQEPNSPPIPWHFTENVAGDWTFRDDPKAPYGRVAVSEQGRLLVPLYGCNPVLRFLVHPWSGQVKVTFNRRTHLLNLYSSEARDFHLHLN